MLKTEKKLLEAKNKNYKVLSYDNKEIHYEDNKGYRYKKIIYNKGELSTDHKYDIKNPYCIYNINHMLQISDSNTRLVEESYIGGKERATFICGNCGKEFQAIIRSLEKYKYKCCGDCVRILQDTKKSKYEDIKNEIESYGYVLLNDYYEGNHNRVKVKLETLRNGGSISKFALYNPYALDNIKLFCKLNGFDCSIPNQNYKGWEHPLKIQCSCGKIYTIDTSKLVNASQYKCTSCTSYFSYLEDFVEKWLIENNIKHIRQYIIKECRYKKPLPFDFYLPEYEILIEVQGEQHYRPVDKFGGEKSYQLQLKKDAIKKQYCDYHNITLILLSYKDIKSKKYIEILKKSLNI